MTATRTTPTFDVRLGEMMFLGQSTMLLLQRHFAEPRFDDPAWIARANRHAKGIAQLYEMAIAATPPDEYRKAQSLWTDAIRNWHEALVMAFNASSSDPAGTQRSTKRAWKKATRLISRGGATHQAAVKELEAVRMRRVLRRQAAARAARRDAA